MRPNLPTGPAPLPQQIKPVNEEPDETRSREPPRNHNNQDDDTDLSDDPPDSQEGSEESEENVPRAVSNLGTVGSISRTSANIGPTAQPVQYRPVSGSGSPTGRGSGIPTAPALAPVQYRPTAKPNKPRKPIEEPFKQQVKPSAKSVKPSQSYDARGKKPVAQVSFKQAYGSTV